MASRRKVSTHRLLECIRPIIDLDDESLFNVLTDEETPLTDHQNKLLSNLANFLQWEDKKNVTKKLSRVVSLMLLHIRGNTPLGGLAPRLSLALIEMYNGLFDGVKLLDTTFCDLKDQMLKQRVKSRAARTMPQHHLDWAIDGPYACCHLCEASLYVDTEVTKLPCGHLFHGFCIGPWLLSGDTCPCCFKGIHMSSS